MPADRHARLGVVDGLRGVAALAVCWYHLTNGNPQFLADGWLKRSGQHGWLGVEVFFVISGFIVPLSMARGGYRLARDGARFLAKRIVRLDPPYLTTVVLTVALWYVSSALPGFRGAIEGPRLGDVIGHLGYLNGVLGRPWLNPAFWSLAIEFQFYLAIAVVFPVVHHQRPSIAWAGLAGVWLCALVGSQDVWVPHYAGLFGCGLVCFLWREQRCGTPTFVLALLAMAAAVAWSAGLAIATVALATAAVIAVGRGASRAGAWLGSVSYSLYLVHVPVGGRVVNLGVRLGATGGGAIAMLGIALAASIGTAIVLHRFVEQPAQLWASRIRYRSPRPDAVAPPATALAL